MAGKKNKPKNKKTVSKPKSKEKKTQGIHAMFWIGIALVITAIVFFPSLSNDFVNWDDDVNLLENKNLEVFDWPHIKAIFSTTVMGGYNPLSIFTLALEKHFFDLNPRVFHTTNLLLHLLAVMLVYRILIAMRLSPMAALLGALLFGIHPMRVESVAWVTERKDVLFGVFYLGAVLTYIRSLLEPKRKIYFYVFTLALFLFSLFSKIQAVALPLSLLALDYYFQRPLKWSLLWEKIPFFAMSLGIGLLGIYLLSTAETLTDATAYSLPERLLVGAYSFCIYLVKFIFPYEMSPLYPYPAKIPWYIYTAPLGVLGMGYWFYQALKKKDRATVFGLAFFAFNIFFVLQILAAGQGFKADRFTYIPYFGLFFLVAYYWQYWLEKKPEQQLLLQGGMVLYLLLFAGMTWQQCGVWKNGGSLWTHVIKYYPNTALPFGNLGHYYRQEKNYAKALENYNAAVRLNTREGKTFNSRGKTYFDMGNAQKALEDYNRAIEMDPNLAEFYVNRGAAYGSLGDLNKALKDLNQGVELDPEFKNVYLNRSLVYTQTNQHQKALDDINTYLRLDPYSADMWYEKSTTLRRLNQTQGVIEGLNTAIQLNPDKGLFWYERAKVYYNQGKTNESKRDARRAQELGINVEEVLLGR